MSIIDKKKYEEESVTIMATDSSNVSNELIVPTYHSSEGACVYRGLTLTPMPEGIQVAQNSLQSSGNNGESNIVCDNRNDEETYNDDSGPFIPIYNKYYVHIEENSPLHPYNGLHGDDIVLYFLMQSRLLELKYVLQCLVKALT